MAFAKLGLVVSFCCCKLHSEVFFPDYDTRMRRSIAAPPSSALFPDFLHVSQFPRSLLPVHGGFIVSFGASSRRSCFFFQIVAKLSTRVQQLDVRMETKVTF